MPNPTSYAVHANRPLTGISVAFANNGPFIADKVFPTVPVSHQSDTYYTYDKADWFRSEAQLRAPGTESAGSGYRLGEDNYRCDVYAIHKDVNDQQRANQDQPINLDREAAVWVARQGMLKKETGFFARYFTTGVWTGSTTGTDIVPAVLWSAAAGDPVNDITTQQDFVAGRTGYLPNTMVNGVDTHREIRNNADVLDRIKYTQRGVVTEELLAALFNIDRYFVGRSIVETEEEGSATDGTGYIADAKDCLLTYSSGSPSLMEPTGGYTFVWTGLSGSRDGMVTSRFRMDALKSDRIELEFNYDQKLVAPSVGVFFNGAVA